MFSTCRKAQLMAERKFSNRPLQLDQLQNIICVFCYQIRLQKERRIPQNIEGLIELRYLINLFILYVPEMTSKNVNGSVIDVNVFPKT